MDSYDPYRTKRCTKCRIELSSLEESISFLLKTELLCALHRRIPEGDNNEV